MRFSNYWANYCSNSSDNIGRSLIGVPKFQFQGREVFDWVIIVKDSSRGQCAVCSLKSRWISHLMFLNCWKERSIGAKLRTAHYHNSCLITLYLKSLWSRVFIVSQRNRRKTARGRRAYPMCTE